MKKIITDANVNGSIIKFAGKIRIFERGSDKIYKAVTVLLRLLLILMIQVLTVLAQESAF